MLRGGSWEGGPEYRTGIEPRGSQSWVCGRGRRFSLWRGGVRSLSLCSFQLTHIGQHRSKRWQGYIFSRRRDDASGPSLMRKCTVTIGLTPAPAQWSGPYEGGNDQLERIDGLVAEYQTSTAEEFSGGSFSPRNTFLDLVVNLSFEAKRRRPGISNHPYSEGPTIPSTLSPYSGRAQKGPMIVYLRRFTLCAHLPFIAILQACGYRVTLKNSERKLP